MNSSSPQLLVPDRGYSFDPPCAPDHPGYHQLLVWLRAAPTRRHYDPETVACRVTSTSGGHEALMLRYPLANPATYRVCPGRIVLNDRKDKRVEAFTFGGELRVEPAEATVMCRFRSPTPIFPLVDVGTLACEFVAEVETILAELRAQSESQPSASAFDDRLAALEPVALYLACLAAVRERVQALTRQNYEPARHVLRFVREEQDELEAAGRWPTHVAALAELLQA